MNRIRLLLLCSLICMACRAQTDTSLLSPSIFEKAIAAGNAQLVDVRTPAEYEKGRIKNSVLADWKKREQFARTVQALDSSRPVYLYCAAGVRSHAAALYLRSKGFMQVYELEGGMDKWEEEKKAVER